MNKFKSTTIAALSTVFAAVCSVNAVAQVTHADVNVDNFASYQEGTQIDAANSAYNVANVNGSDLVATVSSDFSKSGGQSLYLLDNNDSSKPVVSRAFTDGAADSGTVTASVYIPSDGYVKSTYLYLGNSKGASSSQRFTEVVFGKSDVKFRNESGKLVDIAKYDQNTWVDVTISWQPAGDGYDVAVLINGEEHSGLKAQNSAGGAPTLFALYAGDNKAVNNFSYFDNVGSNLF